MRTTNIDIVVEPMKYHGPGYTTTVRTGTCEVYAQVWLPQTAVSPGAEIRGPDGTMIPTPPRAAYAAAWDRTCLESDRRTDEYVGNVTLDEALAVFDQLDDVGAAVKAAFTEAVSPTA